MTVTVDLTDHITGQIDRQTDPRVASFVDLTIAIRSRGVMMPVHQRGGAPFVRPTQRARRIARLGQFTDGGPRRARYVVLARRSGPRREARGDLTIARGRPIATASCHGVRGQSDDCGTWRQSAQRSSWSRSENNVAGVTRRQAHRCRDAGDIDRGPCRTTGAGARKPRIMGLGKNKRPSSPWNQRALGKDSWKQHDNAYRMGEAYCMALPR